MKTFGLKKTVLYCVITCLIIISCSALLSGQEMKRTNLNFSVSFPETLCEKALDGHLLLLIANNDRTEPRFQLSDGASTQLVFGIDIEGMEPGEKALIDKMAFGYPLESIAYIP